MSRTTSLPSNRARLCAGLAPPWSGPANAVSLEPDEQEGKLFFPVSLDGHPLTAFLDTGAGGSAVQQSALDLGPALAHDPVRRVFGIGLQGTDLHRHRFGHLRINGVDYGAARVGVGALQTGKADMLLGEDFLRRHRVFIAFRAHKLFIGG